MISWGCFETASSKQNWKISPQKSLCCGVPSKYRNIQSLAVELCKFFHGLSPSVVKNVFHLNTNIPYKLSSCSGLYSRNPKTVKYGTETISYLAPKIWSLVPNAIKSSKSLDVFKSKIKQWEPDCPCRLCKNYLQHVGFI